MIFEKFIGKQRLQVIFGTSFGYTRERYRWRIETKFGGQNNVASAGKRRVWCIRFLDVCNRTWLLSKNVNGRIYE